MATLEKRMEMLLAGRTPSGGWSVAELAEALQITRKHVSTVLSHLRKVGIARPVDRGHWALVPEGDREAATQHPGPETHEESGVQEDGEHATADPGRVSPQLFRGATLSSTIAKFIEGDLAAVGSTRLLRAMVLAWRQTPAPEREALLQQAATAESTAAALFDIETDPNKEVRVQEAEEALAAAKGAFPRAIDGLTPDELYVARQRLLPEPPSLEAIGATRGGYTREWARQQEERAFLKLRRWLVELLAGA